MKIFIDDDFIDDDDDDDDDDDVVEGTRTGPSAARSDLEHQVNHNAKISHFYHVFRSYEEGGPTGAGKTRCLAVYVLYISNSPKHTRIICDGFTLVIFNIQRHIKTDHYSPNTKHETSPPPKQRKQTNMYPMVIAMEHDHIS